MHKEIKKKILEISDTKENNEIEILTNHLKINGTIHKCEGKCKCDSDYMLPLTNVTVCRLNDYCTCDEDTCECNDYICFRYHWLNVSITDIVAFSIPEFIEEDFEE